MNGRAELNFTEESRKNILKNFLETIKFISDIEYQRRAWIRGEPPGTDFDETVNYYSLEADEILEHYKYFGVSEAQFQVLKKFDKIFCDFYNKNDWPQEFIDTPEWQQIIALAKGVLEAFNSEKSDLVDRKSTLTNKAKKQILISVLENIEGISDKEYQKRVWIRGEGPEVDDFDETCCNFFGDGDPLLKNYKDFELTESQYSILKQFRDEFKTFSGENAWPPNFIDTPEWAKIMNQAKEVLKAFKYKKDNDSQFEKKLPY